MKNELDRSALPDLYRTAFTRDHTALFGGRRMSFSVVRAGTLYLPSGRIVACDPLVGQKRTPFVQNVLPGRYVVDLSLGLDTTENVERILFSRILFTKNTPLIWVKALRENEVGRADDEGFGFSTPSGTAAYMDREASVKFGLDSADELDRFLDKLVANHRPKRSWLNYPLDHEYNGIFFTSSRTNGPVATFFAVDESGDICLALSSLFL